MSLPRLSQRQKAGLAVALALLLWAPSGISHGDAAVVTGHSTFYDGDSFSPCLASVAGIMRHRVMWFNDQVLVETYGGAGTFIWVAEQGSEDPRQKKLYTEGVFYDFVDPNGAHWHVEELFYDKTDQVRPQADIHDDPVGVDNVSVSLYGKRSMVWVVELAPRPIFDEFAGDDPHTYYNFLVLVDTCKIHSNDVNTAYSGVADHSNESGLLNDRHGHENGEDPHTHETYMMDLYIGKRPTTVLPWGASTDGAEWQTEWATQEASGEANEQSGNQLGDLAP